ncbi:TetR/AcrR family transcriptional regulator [Bifidobacterium sp. 64T4]|uniref:TetR/AcrR family transcriptional regulator n=1 Tax=Bifidobacterium pongonis TaxID=2834432 RepID=UPI001C5A1CB6|nr:TetR/AcrR family transcriptional regulator [Bifidobacterium pongonis]MBW3094470.1 TetR/AcrR family transcriptional regulator [Bifidobacterium pongonis]
MPRPRLDCDTPSAIQRMIDTFWQLLSERNYRSITVTDIVRRANVNRNSFYYHFNKLDELAYRAIHDEVNRSPLVQSGGAGNVPDLQHWRRHVGELISTDEERKRTSRLTMIVGPHTDPVLYSAFHDNEREALLLVLGLAPEDVDSRTDLMLDFIIGGIMGMLSRWLQMNENRDTSPLADDDATALAVRVYALLLENCLPTGRKAAH